MSDKSDHNDSLLEQLLLTVHHKHQKLNNQTNDQRININWDILGVLALFITLFGAAILYTCGWAYEAAWYGYFGIELSSLELPLYQTMVEGFPFMFLILGSISIPYLLDILSILSKSTSKPKQDNSHSKLPKILDSYDIIISTGLLYLIFSHYTIVQSMPSTLTLLLIIMGLVRPTVKITLTLALFLFRTILLVFSRKKVYYDVKSAYITRTQSYEAIYNKHILRANRISLIPALVSALIAIPSVGGSIDAYNYGKPLSGDWSAPRVFINLPLDSGLNILPPESQNPDNKHSYGPFALISQTSHYLYLTDWSNKENPHIEPDVYIIPLDGVQIHIIPE